MRLSPTNRIRFTPAPCPTEGNPALSPKTSAVVVHHSPSIISPGVLDDFLPPPDGSTGSSDGSTISAGLLMGNDLSLPFSSPLKVDGGIVGSLTYASQRGRRISGDLNWMSSSLTTALSANGSPYTVPREGVAAIPLTSGEPRFFDPKPEHDITTAARLNSLN